MIRSKGEAGTGNVVEAVRHMRSIRGEHRRARRRCDRRSCYAARQGPAARRTSSCSRRRRARAGCRSSLFSAGGIATPADAALMMQLGADGVFVGSGIFKSDDPAPRARGDRRGRPRTSATPKLLAKVSDGARRADGRHRARQARADDERLAKPRLVSGASASACSRCRARSASTCALLRGAGRRRRSRCARPTSSSAATRLVLPGGESTTIGKLLDSSGLDAAAARATDGCRCSAPAPA